MSGHMVPTDRILKPGLFGTLALVISLASLFFVITTLQTPCANAQTGTCNVGDTETFTGPVSITDGSTAYDLESTGYLDIQPGNRTEGPVGTLPVSARWRGATYQDNTSSGAISDVLRVHQYDQMTLSSTNAVTYAEAVMLNVNMPVAGTNVTITRPWAIWSDGPINVDDSTDIDYADVNDGSFHTGGGVSVNKSIWTREVMALSEMSAPTGQANVAKIFAEDNGAGKTRLMVQFGTGAAQQIAIEP